jgi:hypothetical protein
LKRYWTEEEIQYLEENVGKIKVSTIAQNLNRTENAVLVKMKRLGLSNTKEQLGLLTIGGLAKLLKVDPNTVRGWVKNHGLPCHKKVTRNQKRFYFIDPTDFWIWAEKHKEKIDFSKIEKHSIAPEPEWVDKERTKKKTTNYKSWTTYEIRVMVDLLKNGANYKTVGEKLQRSPISIERKFKRLQQISR